MILFASLFNTPDWFGIILSVGFVSGFGVAAAVGGALDSAGMNEAAVAVLSAIVGGVIFARWGSKKRHTNELPALDKLPEDMRTGIISLPGQRPSVGCATTSPYSFESIALHVAALAVSLFLADILTNWVNDAFPALSFPLFAMDFLVAVGIASIVPAVVWLFGRVALIGGLALLIPPMIMLKKSKTRAS